MDEPYDGGSLSSAYGSRPRRGRIAFINPDNSVNLRRFSSHPLRPVRAGGRLPVIDDDVVDRSGGDPIPRANQLPVVVRDDRALGSRQWNFIDTLFNGTYDGQSIFLAGIINPIPEGTDAGYRQGRKVRIKGFEFRLRFGTVAGGNYVSNAGFSWAGAAAIPGVPGQTAQFNNYQLNSANYVIPQATFRPIADPGAAGTSPGALLYALPAPTGIPSAATSLGGGSNQVIDVGLGGPGNFKYYFQQATDGLQAFPLFPSIVLPPTNVYNNYQGAVASDTRILVFFDKKPVTLGAPPYSNQVLQQTSSPVGTWLYNSTNVPSRFEILYDTVFTNPGSAGIITAVCPWHAVYDNTVWTDASATNISANALCAFIFGMDNSSGTSLSLTYTGNFRVYYSDQ